MGVEGSSETKWWKKKQLACSSSGMQRLQELLDGDRLVGISALSGSFTESNPLTMSIPLGGVLLFTAFVAFTFLTTCFVSSRNTRLCSSRYPGQTL